MAGITDVKYHQYFDFRENILGQLIPVTERLTWQKEHCCPSDRENQRDGTGPSFKTEKNHHYLIGQ